METPTVLLFALGGLLAFIGAIMLLVAAFRQSVWWGLALLLVPFANLVFAILHWAKAKTGVFVTLAGMAAVICALATSPMLRNFAGQLRHFDFAQFQTAGFQFKQPPPAPSLDAQIQQQRDRLDQLESKFAEDGAALVQQFQKLTDERKSLKKDDLAVNAFNAQAADYQARNTLRPQAGREIDALRTELEALLDQRSRLSAPATGGKRVVMYSTANCPACKMAKAYLAKKGVAYEERDLNSSPEARADFQKLGGHGVPLILIGTERMEGFNSQRLDQLL